MSLLWLYLRESYLSATCFLCIIFWIHQAFNALAFLCTPFLAAIFPPISLRRLISFVLALSMCRHLKTLTVSRRVLSFLPMSVLRYSVFHRLRVVCASLRVVLRLTSLWAWARRWKERRCEKEESRRRLRCTYLDTLFSLMLNRRYLVKVVRPEKDRVRRKVARSFRKRCNLALKVLRSVACTLIWVKHNFSLFFILSFFRDSFLYILRLVSKYH